MKEMLIADRSPEVLDKLLPFSFIIRAKINILEPMLKVCPVSRMVPKTDEAAP